MLWFGLVWTLVLMDSSLCNPVSTSFNNNIRTNSAKEAVVIKNSTARTLQQEDLGRYANFAPVSNHVRFKEEVPDNDLSGSAYTRGLLPHDHDHGGAHGYGVYEEGHYGYGFDHDYHGYPVHHGNDYHGHHGPHGHHLGHGHHHKHYDHTLAAKTILWPLAGLAILGTAAALVSNPVLLQLGVISGRRRRDTQEVTGPEYDFDKWNKEVAGDDKIFILNGQREANNGNANEVDFKSKGLKKKRVKDVKQGVLSKKAYQRAHSTVETITLNTPRNNGQSAHNIFVPIDLKIKKN